MLLLVVPQSSEISIRLITDSTRIGLLSRVLPTDAINSTDVINTVTYAASDDSSIQRD